MTEINPCPDCKRKAVSQECAGGWMVYCYYASPFHCVEDDEPWCDQDHPTLFDGEEEAIEAWNNA